MTSSSPDPSRRDRATYALSCRHVSVHYRTQKRPTLADINFDIGWGEKVAILGASGSGKSTLMQVLNGLIPHYYDATIQGEVRVGGVDPTHESLTSTSAAAGTILQDSDAQFVGLTVAEDIAFSLENQCVPTDSMPQRVHAVAERMGLLPLLSATPTDLSGGQKQRVALAGVLVDEVPILLFDEPLAHLDPATGRATIELIDTLNKKHGTTVVIVEHRFEEVLHRGVDRVLLLADGCIVFNGTPNELVRSGLLPSHGIREPLHLPALRYAGVGMEEFAAPARIADVMPQASVAARVRAWAQEGEPPSAPDVPRTEASHPNATHPNATHPNATHPNATHPNATHPNATHPDVPRTDVTHPGTTTMSPALEIEELHLWHGTPHDPRATHALRGVNLTVGSGEMVAVLGNNGAGKSSLAKVVAGFETAASGHIAINGVDISTLNRTEIGNYVGFVLQHPGYMISCPFITEEIALGLRARGLSEAEVNKRIERVLRICGLTPFRDWPVSALSHGQKKRVTIAAVLALEPRIIILDEPTAGQDYRHYTEFMEFLVRINREGTTIITITHDMHLALEYSTRVIVLSEGTVAADSTAARVLADPIVTSRANLVPTALYDLATRVGIEETREQASFVERFIQRDRSEREAQHV